MGWLFCEPTRKQLVDRIMGDHFAGEHVVIKDHSHQGNKLWVLYAYRHDPDNRFIVLYLLAGTPRRPGEYVSNPWGYKDVDESLGPTHYGCPERLLKQSTCNHDYAVAWRDECRKANAHEAKRKKYVKALQRSDTFRYGEKRATYLYDNTGSAFVVAKNEDGEVRRYWKSRILLPEASA